MVNRLPAQGIQLPNGCSTAQEYATQLMTFSDRYRWLTELHVMDFITNEHWDLLDPTWRETLLPNVIEDDDTWFMRILQLASDAKSDHNWPESLQDYLSNIQKLTLERECYDKIPCDKIDKKMLGGMSGKKVHEVEQMSALIQSVAKPQEYSVLDLGAGQGYLSRALALHYNLQVLGVDMSEIQTRGAQKFDAKALHKSSPLSLLSTSVAAVAQPRLEHITQRVTPKNVDSILEKRDPLGNHNWLVCGLHTCGDLGSTTMRLFAKSDQVQGLVHVGCCYHYLTESDSPDRGFPMSEHVDGHTLGTTARVLACQSPSRWIDQPRASLDTFDQHFFRAMFQDLLVHKGLVEQASALVLGKLNKQKKFDGFVKKALERLEISADAISSEEAILYEQQCRNNRVDKKLIVLWTLRALMGPILESLVLTDRYLYLCQSVPSSQVWMWPLFSPAQSPRNMVFVALKSTQLSQKILVNE